MKKIILSLLLLTSLSVVKTYAQMEAARKVKWDIEKSIDVNMEMDLVWDVFNNNELMKKASNGYISAIEVIDANMPISRKVIFSNGSSRLENITQNEAHNRLIAIDFVDSNLPKGIKSVQYVVYIKAKDSQSNVMWRVLIKGDEDAKKALMAQLMVEFDSYAAGFDKMTKKTIPAARMN
ncbi:hypothetical protein [Pedobacter nyackensis]|uniref:hypothetical protein n=1 Tax=Pedobacter nyackensis TaxID=475255 RepID=UPI00292E1EED|nr:hypothetical protein [Pedobacter nyackensis]